MNKSFVFECRDAARVCPDHVMRAFMQDAATKLASACHEFGRMATVENLQRVNGCWAKANRILMQITPEPEGTGGGGRVRTDDELELRVA